MLSTVLFGSKARGASNKESDIDILIVLKNKNSVLLNQIVNILVDIQLNYDANISPLIYSEYEFKMNRELGSYFIENLEKEGIPL
ncbi:MAG: nucleotidyltransferase domain-containing protein [Melioribacteraceae bacterium]|nr:nucleotidyltransferase domain-containing protein [Melioribacteraceae bacterium]